jgi:hypothetical protein
MAIDSSKSVQIRAITFIGAGAAVLALIGYLLMKSDRKKPKKKSSKSSNHNPPPTTLNTIDNNLDLNNTTNNNHSNNTTNTNCNLITTNPSMHSNFMSDRNSSSGECLVVNNVDR